MLQLNIFSNLMKKRKTNSLQTSQSNDPVNFENLTKMFLSNFPRSAMPLLFLLKLENNRHDYVGRGFPCCIIFLRWFPLAVFFLTKFLSILGDCKRSNLKISINHGEKVNYKLLSVCRVCAETILTKEWTVKLCQSRQFTMSNEEVFSNYNDEWRSAKWISFSTNSFK